MTDKIVLAVATVLRQPIEAIAKLEWRKGADAQASVLNLLSAAGKTPHKVWDPWDFSKTYYEGKWCEVVPTAYHPHRLDSFWAKVANSTWIIIGAKSGQAVGVINGSITLSHLETKFKATSIVEVVSGSPSKTPVGGASTPPGYPIPGKEVQGPRTGGERPVQPVPGVENGEFSGPLAGTALSYASWALDCLRRKQYKDADAHLVKALRLSKKP